MEAETGKRGAYSVAAAATYLSVSERQVRKFMADGELLTRYIGRKPVIPAAELDALNKRLPTEPPGR